MELLFNEDELYRISEQAAVDHCACSARLCQQLDELRSLYALQQACGRGNAREQRVHDRIAAAVEVAHEALEHCLSDVLAMAGWDMDALAMPAETLAQGLARR